MIEVYECSKIMKCTAFEDNNRALEMAKIPKINPHMKHIAIKYHHFCACTKKGDIMLEKIDATKEEVDFLIKTVVQYLFSYLRRKLID